MNENFNYTEFLTSPTNAILEGFNSKISLIKSRARGFRNMDNFKNMIYFCMGGFDFPFISYYGVSAIYPSEIANNQIVSFTLTALQRSSYLIRIGECTVTSSLIILPAHYILPEKLSFQYCLLSIVHQIK